MRRRADAVIFGAGPAGLATGHRLVEKGREVIIIERDSQVGGLSKTIEFKKCRFDLGGHRFFTKSKKVNELWENTLGEDLLKRPRLSRIYYNKNKFFDYPIKPFNALRGFGFFMSASVILSYIRSKICPHKEERTFEQWVTNRFGRKLFEIFFKIYTEKLWAIPCSEIEAEWAAQRIKGLSLRTALKNAIFPDKKGNIKTLINEFKYPKYGPGMMYEKLAENISCRGASIILRAEVVEIIREDFFIKGVIVKNKDGTDHACTANHFVSSIPITETIKRLNPQPPKEVLAAAFTLKYRSFIAVNVILNSAALFPDTWIYIHAPEVRLGRIQNFKKWSPYMVPEDGKTALGLEYFCNEGDDLWIMRDEQLINFGMEELEKIGLGKKKDFQDGFVVRVPKAYPVYDSEYREKLSIIRRFIENFENLQVVGRYGMFKYNNMDHSILTGLYAAENILCGCRKHDIWSLNANPEYHEGDMNLE